jgi:hypothetical protein
MNEQDSERVKQLIKIRDKAAGRLANMNVSFYPTPQNNKRNLIRNNKTGFKFLMEYLTAELEIQTLIGNLVRSKAVEEQKSALEAEFEKIQQEGRVTE